MTGGTGIQPITVRAGGPVPSRVALASEQFSGLIDFLLPRARRDYCDLDTATQARYLDAYHATDTLADAMVTYLRDHGGAGRQQLDQALERGIGSVTGPPPQLSAFLCSVDQLPAVIDLARVEEGARCLRRIGAITITGFGMAAGFYLGAILPGPARALGASTRTVQQPARRLSETAKFVLGTFAPGGYGRFGDGCKNATRLRLTHAAIRARLHQHGSWDASIYGAPLSQADTLMAAMTFNVLPALAAARLGYRFARHEEDCLAHFSACAACRQGVPADLLSVTLDQQRAFIYFMLRTARGGVDPQSTHAVMRPLVTAAFPGLPAPVQPLARAILHGYGRLFFGDELCDRTGIPDTTAKRLIPLTRPAITLLELARTRSRTIQALADRAAAYRWNTLMPRTSQLMTEPDATRFAAY
jgi:ER-bound oxygenase mpaB/B'/Rubber oxygenase, catalytic domain